MGRKRGREQERERGKTDVQERKRVCTLCVYVCVKLSEIERWLASVCLKERKGYTESGKGAKGAERLPIGPEQTPAVFAQPLEKADFPLLCQVLRSER